VTVTALIRPKVMAVAALLFSAPAVIAQSCLIEPVNIGPNLVTSVFGKTRTLPQYAGAPQVHWGVDLQARNPANSGVGADLLAVDNGTVIGAGFWGSGYGNRVALKRENGDIVVYSHLAQVEPRLKSGGAIGFRDAIGTASVGNNRVNVGEKVGVAGGTSDHMNTNKLAVHLHLEYITDYAGTKLRETNDGTNETRSRYLRNPLQYMCRSIAHAPGAGVETSGTGGGLPVPAGGSVTNKPNNPNSDAQVYEASQTQPSVTDRERYGIPDTAPYATYDGMSESQIVEAEMLRRTLDTEWETKLTEWGRRGLWMEIARIDGVRLWLEQRIAEKNARVEAMVATRLAFRTNQYFNPRLQSAYSKAQTVASTGRVK
jgi:hypothetical protein